MKLLSTVLAVVSILSLSGCGSENSASVDLVYGNKYDMIVSSADKINCDYLLVYHDKSSYNEVDAYINLLEKLTLSSAGTFQLCPDTLNIKDAKQKIILLGDTSYNESYKSGLIIDEIRSNNYYDYLFRAYGNTVSINWASKFGREDAFNYLLDNLIPNGLNKAFEKGYSYLYLSQRSDFPIVTIDDVNIVQYTVVIPDAPSLMERSCAEQLIKVVKEATGVELPLVTDDVEESTYEILIGDTNRGETYVTSFFANNRFTITQYGSKLILRGGQVEATAAATSLFTSNIENSYITAEPLNVKAGYCYTSNIERYNGNKFEGYKLVFLDEFSSYTLNENLWNNVEDAVSTYGSALGLMYYSPDNVDFDGSNIILSTRLGSYGYETGRISTFNKASFQYGYFETRVRMRTAPGFWAKLILTNMEHNDVNVSQIDVFNALDKNDTVFASLGIMDKKSYYEHYLSMMDPSYEAYRSTTLSEDELLIDDKYHTFGIEWTETYVRYFIDGIQYATIEVSSNKYAELNKEMYLDFIMGVEMTEQETIDEVAQWPIDVEVDWVRVYQKEGSSMTWGEMAQ